MSLYGLLRSRRALIALLLAMASSVAAACGSKGDEPALFNCDRGSKNCQCATDNACLPGLVCDRGIDRCVDGGGAGSGGSGGSSGGSVVASGGTTTGGTGDEAGAPSNTASGGSPDGTGGVTSVTGGAGNSSGGTAGTGGTGEAGAEASGGTTVAGSGSGGGGGDVPVAGSDQGGSSSSEGGAAGGAGDASSGAAGAGPGSHTIEIGDLHDTFVDACDVNDNNGSEQTLSVDIDPCVFEIYIKPASLSELPSGATIESAFLELQWNNPGDTVEVLRITEAWNEGAVDWDSRPSLGTEVDSILPTEGAVIIDVTSLVQEWLDGEPIYGVALVQTTGDDGSDYHSSESNGQNAPRILVTYTP